MNLYGNNIVEGDQATQESNKMLQILLEQGILDPRTLQRMQGMSAPASGEGVPPMGQSAPMVPQQPQQPPPPPPQAPPPQAPSPFEQAFGTPEAPVSFSPTDPSQPASAEEAMQGFDVPSLPDEVAGLGGPSEEPKKRRGFWGRVDDRPGGRDALLAFGANLLSEPNFFQGLGKGAMAYKDTLNAERDKFRPQLSKDGYYSYRRNPQTGEFDMVETAAGRLARNLALKKIETPAEARRYAADKGYDGRVETAEMEFGFKRDRLEYEDRWKKEDNRTKLEVARINGDFSLDRAKLNAAAGSGKPPPVGAFKMFDEATEKYTKGQQVMVHGSAVLEALDNNEIDLSLAGNLWAKGAQIGVLPAGASTRAYAELQQFKQMMVNGILLDARGVQTDGDAMRAGIMALVSSGDNVGAAAEIRRILSDHEAGMRRNREIAAMVADTYGLEGKVGDIGSAPSPKPKASSRKPSVSNW